MRSINFEEILIKKRKIREKTISIYNSAQFCTNNDGATTGKTFLILMQRTKFQLAKQFVRMLRFSIFCDVSLANMQLPEFISKEFELE